MIKGKALIVTGFILVTIASGTFAKGIAWSSSVKGIGEIVLPITVETPKEVLNWFIEKGFDAAQYDTELSSMPISYRNSIRKAYAVKKNKDALDKIAVLSLQKYLQEGSVESVTTSYGPFTWTVKYIQKKEKL